MMSSRYGLDELGYTCATMVKLQRVAIMQVLAILENLSQFGSIFETRIVKLESLVIVDQHATVNKLTGLVHTARHAMGAGVM